jgi:cell division septum initiation protein DivIVA
LKTPKWIAGINTLQIHFKHEIDKLKENIEELRTELQLCRMADAELTQRIAALVTSLHKCSDAPEVKSPLGPAKRADCGQPCSTHLIDSDFVVDSFHSIGRRAEGDLKQIVVAGRFDADIAQGPLLVHVLGGAAYRLREAHKVHITVTEVIE